MWKLYHIAKVGTSLLSGNVGWAGYHAIKAITWKTKKKSNKTINDKDAIKNYKILLKGEDKTDSVESFYTTSNKTLKVKFFGNDTVYTYSSQNYQIIKEK